MSHTHQPTEGHTFAAHAMPAEPETEALTLQSDGPKTAYDPAILTALKGLVDDGRNGETWSRNRVAKALGVSPATVSIYLRQNESTPPLLKASLPKLESLITDFLTALNAKREFNGSLFQTAISNSMGRWIDMVRATGTIGLYLGQAGVGKSCGLELYAQANPMSLVIAAKPWSRTRNAVIAMLWRQFDTRGWDRRSPKADWLAHHLTGLETVLLVDDAHTLTFSALEYLIYLAEVTSTPLVLVGNPRVIEKLRTEPQLYSRVFLRQEGAWKAGAGLNEAVEAVLQREAPDHVDALRPLARQVAAQSGHLRGLTQRCRGMREILHTAEYTGQPAKAFHAAHALSLHSGQPLALS